MPETQHATGVTAHPLALELLTVHDDHIAHRNLLNQLTEVDLLILDDFLTVGVDPRATNDLFTVLADRDRRVATMVLGRVSLSAGSGSATIDR